MSLEYFEIAGVLFVAYCVIRFFIWTELRLDTRPDPPPKPFDGAIKPIDTKALSHRLQDVRRDYTVGKPAPSDSFKRRMHVNPRLEPIVRFGFFQKPAPGPP